MKIVPLPKAKGVGLIFFATVAEAMQATVELLDLKPAAIEHVDNVLFDQTKGQLPFKAARDLLELDAKPCKAFLVVEFFDDNVPERLAALAQKNLGLRTTILKNNNEIGLVWAMRKAGMALVTGCPGDIKPVTCIEDAAVRPEQLPEYVAGLEALMKPLGLTGSFYGHAASGSAACSPRAQSAQCGGREKDAPACATKSPRSCASSRARSRASTAWASPAPNMCPTISARN